MNYFQKKKLAFMSIVNRVKGFIRTITGVFPLTLTNCVDEESITDYTIYGASGGVGEYDKTSGKYKIPITVSGSNLLSSQKWVSGSNSTGFTESTANHITSVGENYVEATLPTWNGIGSAKISCTDMRTVGFKINLDSVAVSDSYILYQPVLQFYNKDGDKVSNKALSNAITANTEYVFELGVGFIIPSKATHVSLCVLSRGRKVEGIRIYDFFITKDVNGINYEPYHEPIATNIYRDEPLGEGQSINYKKDSLPNLPTFKGTSIISADTTIQPSNAEIEYYSNVKE